MKNEPVKLFLIDDEFPKPEELRKKHVFESGVPTEVLYHLAINEEWVPNLRFLQDLIKNIVSSQACKEKLIELVGFSSPTQALVAISKGIKPNIVVYDWEYTNAPMHGNQSQEWLLDILKMTDSFVFVYSYMRDKLPQFLNTADFTPFYSRFQLLLKGGKMEHSFSAEELIFQYVIGTATASGQIKIDGIDIEFTSNNYLKYGSDILYLQRILGRKYVLDQLNSINFSVDDASVEKILNDSEGYILFNKKKAVLISPDFISSDRLSLEEYERLSYLDVVKKFSITYLETVLERGTLAI